MYHHHFPSTSFSFHQHGSLFHHHHLTHHMPIINNGHHHISPPYVSIHTPYPHQHMYASPIMAPFVMPVPITTPDFTASVPSPTYTRCNVSNLNIDTYSIDNFENGVKKIASKATASSVQDISLNKQKIKLLSILFLLQQEKQISNWRKKQAKILNTDEQSALQVIHQKLMKRASPVATFNKLTDTNKQLANKAKKKDVAAKLFYTLFFVSITICAISVFALSILSSLPIIVTMGLLIGIVATTAVSLVTTLGLLTLARAFDNQAIQLRTKQSALENFIDRFQQILQKNSLNIKSLEKAPKVIEQKEMPVNNEGLSNTNDYQWDQKTINFAVTTEPEMPPEPTFNFQPQTTPTDAITSCYSARPY